MHACICHLTSSANFENATLRHPPAHCGTESACINPFKRSKAIAMVASVLLSRHSWFSYAIPFAAVPIGMLVVAFLGWKVVLIAAAFYVGAVFGSSGWIDVLSREFWVRCMGRARQNVMAVYSDVNAGEKESSSVSVSLGVDVGVELDDALQRRSLQKRDALLVGIAHASMLFHIFVTLFCYIPWSTSWGLSVVHCMLLVVSILSYWQTARMDPGIIPMAQVTAAQQSGTGTGRGGLPVCSTCNVPKPLRSKHCRVCNHCVSRFDHHCPWTGSCVGERNHPWFYLFICSTLWAIVTAFLLRMASFDAQYVHPETGELISFYYRYFGSLTASLMTYTLVYEAMHSIPIIMLVVSHTLLILQNLTTNEQVNWWKYDYLKAKNRAFVNPYDRGWVRNVAAFFSGAKVD